LHYYPGLEIEYPLELAPELVLELMLMTALKLLPRRRLMKTY
jgi:hypothetical protein